MSDKPPSRLRRLARLTSLTGSVAGSYVGERVKSALAGRGELTEKALDKLHIENAERLVETMGKLKGAAMKVGQGMAIAARSLELPPEVAAQLNKLNNEAEPVPFASIREDIEASLGRRLDQAFGSFDETPLGTASLAQAHRATLPDGTDVVVKVLHRGIDGSVQTDLLALKAMLIGSRMLRRDKREVDAAFAEIQARLEEELDYLQEAANIATFHDQWGADPDVRVPRVHGSHSTDRVLTMDRMPGLHIEEFLKVATPEARQRAGETLARLYYTMAFENRTLHADPHPGNYLFEPDGRVGLLDFGCVKRFDEFWIGRYCRLATTAISGDRAAALHEAREMGALVVRDPKTEDALWAFLEALAAHLRKGPFVIGGPDDRIVSEMRPVAKNLAYFPGIHAPADVLFLHRSLAGIYSLARRLKPTLDPGALFSAVAERAIARSEGRL
jgi:predicted unusual protein kinase regulating ubiquinone biosynthesis (AarF/ABC1/UbiB family)